MNIAALVVLLGVAVLSIWAWRQRPAAQLVGDFGSIWQASPWGKQLLVDFYGARSHLDPLDDHTCVREWRLARLRHLRRHHLPLFGTMSAAAYWLLAVGS